jgi:hypothetical protein
MATEGPQPSPLHTHVRHILTALKDHDRFLTSQRVKLPRQFAAAGLARCRALLEGMCALEESGRSDVSGVLGRALLETWLVSAYVILRNDRDSLTDIGAGFAKAARNIAEALEMDGLSEKAEQWTAAVGGPKVAMPSYKDLTKRVTVLLEPKGHRIDPSLLYDLLYRAQSTFDAHGGLGAIGRYLSYGPDGGPDQVVENPGPTFERQIVVGASLVCLLAKLVYKEFSVVVQGLDEAWEAFSEQCQDPEAR